VFGALRRTIGRASVDRFRVIHFSIQQDHGHFIVEGDEAGRARGGMHGLAIRLALAVNRALGRRKGKVVGDRYHVRPLTTPRQMRTSMVYVLLNFRKHLKAAAGIDPRSSGREFFGWHRRAHLESADVGSADADAATTTAASTWMARVGWRRGGGLLKIDERPAAGRRARPPCRASRRPTSFRGCCGPARSPAWGRRRRAKIGALAGGPAVERAG
jgi:hypothetical protein